MPDKNIDNNVHTRLNSKKKLNGGISDTNQELIAVIDSKKYQAAASKHFLRYLFKEIVSTISVDVWMM